MVRLLNKEILDKIDEIILLIESSSNYQKYLNLKDTISNNKDIMILINEIKVLQKDVVHHFDKKELLNKKIEELNNFPLYREYNNILYELNNEFSIVENSINNYFNKKIN